MSKIKSAWEIALEKTADIEIDENKYREDSLVKEGMAMAGSFLNDPQKEIDFIRDKAASYSQADLSLVKKGLKQVVLSNLVLPTDEAYEFRLGRIAQLAVLLNPESQTTMAQIMSFFEQYMNAREDFVSRMKEQINEMMKSNPQQADPAQYTKLIEQNLKKMEDQYSQALKSTVDGLKELL